MNLRILFLSFRDSKVAQLLRDSLGGVSCRTCMLVHVSSAVSHHNETLQVIQLAARIHRMRRRKTKVIHSNYNCDNKLKFLPIVPSGFLNILVFLVCSFQVQVQMTVPRMMEDLEGHLRGAEWGP